ncbi:hypothetical protein Hbl1158_13060 [Halobaculum sp. CBA1158]|uniref:hypothetical protein n=1 Tax=Halobaculum sp. CBA1158 TaxID=2904243 RepID=UPI001F2E7A46|nr:hypothetical protein [Halobaculum sp. CBA1158]UIO99442.1 hypothetical protein Hbl1158_13060 [Halobaculum sp. CBA1158]
MSDGGPDRSETDEDGEYACDNCGAEFTASEAIRTETMGDLDADAWQTLCCPTCGARVKTVFVGDD